MTYLGIDPGASGGIAVIRDGEAWAYKMPSTEKDLYSLLVHEFHQSDSKAHCILESVHSMPGQGVCSSFNFGKNYGMIRMALVASMIPFETVTPQKWQKEFSLPTTKKSGSKTAKKNVHKARAQELFPAIRVTHATADALLLAEFCRRTGR